MPKKIWFKRKAYGFGWHPATIEGWIILGLYIIILCLNAYHMDVDNLTTTDVMMTILPSTVILTGVLILIAYQMGETPVWQWGEPKERLVTKPSPRLKPAVKTSKTRKVLKKKSAKR